MSWIKLDDQFAEHPKVVEAGPLAAWLYVCGLGYCARQLTDGVIPSAQLRRLLPVSNVARLAERLIHVRLWEIADGGYRVHDYLRYNPSRQATLALREQKVAAGRKGGWQKAGNPLAECQPPATTPVPVPSRPTPHEASTQTEHLPQEVTAGQYMLSPLPAAGRAPPNPVSARPAPKIPTAAQLRKAALHEALVARFGAPSNDAAKRKYDQAEKLLAQSKCEPDEIPILAEEYERRDWPSIGPMPIARNVDRLRQPEQGRGLPAALNGRPQRSGVAAARDEYHRITEGFHDDQT